MANELIGKIPPHSLEAEQSLLGALLIDKDAVLKVADALTSEDFYKPSNALIFESMLELFKNRQPIDIVSLGNRLEEKKQIESVGGRSYLIQLSNTVPTSSNTSAYADIIQKKATLRRMMRSASLIQELSTKEDKDIDELLDEAEQNLFSISRKYLNQSFVPIKNILEEAFERIDALHKEKGKLRGIATGFKDLDNYLSGLQKSDLVILAARPSVGKTSLALDIARYAAKSGKSVGIFSLEMSKEQLVDRLICAEAGIDLWKMRTGQLAENTNDFSRIGHALGTLSEAPIYIDDKANVNIMELRAKARRLQMERGLDLIVLDYLQLMESRGRSESRAQEVAEISRALKGIARELNIPILALSQLSRAVEESKPAIPKLSHLRESGSLEQDADVVMFIYRKSADRNYSADELDQQDKTLAQLHIAKHRNGPTGEIKLFFDAQRVCFKNLETKMTAPTMNAPQYNNQQVPPPISEPPF